MKVKRHVSRTLLVKQARVSGTHVKTFVSGRQGPDGWGPVATGRSHLRKSSRSVIERPDDAAMCVAKIEGPS